MARVLGKEGEMICDVHGIPDCQNPGCQVFTKEQSDFLKDVLEARRTGLMQAPDQVDDSDDMAPARGLITCLLMALAAWVLIGVIWVAWVYL